MTLKQFDRAIAWLRFQLRNTTFASNHEGWKDLESLKAKKHAIYPNWDKARD